MKTANKDNVLEIASGAIAELANAEMSKILLNILDPNTSAEKAREMTIKVKFTPNNNRSGIGVTAAVTSKLQPNSAIATQMAIGIDRATGELRAKELLQHLEGQLDFDGNAQDAPVVLQFPNQKTN
jgi:hypothetical protein